MKKMRMGMIMMALAVASLPAWAGSAVIGSVAGSRNASLSGQNLLPNTTVFSGDTLEVRDGAAVVAVGQGSRMVFGQETEASFLREAGGVTVLLNKGNVSMFHPSAGEGLQVKVGAVSVEPVAGYRTMGEVAMVDGAVAVTTKEGTLRVETEGHAMNVTKGHTVTLNADPAPAPPSFNGNITDSTGMQVGALGASALAAILAGVAVGKAGSAKNAANAADVSAQDAIAAANAAANAANQAALNAGCALDLLENQNGMASTFQPPTGESCPPGI